MLRQVVARVRVLMPFHIDAWVVLPEHMHCLWTLPEGDGDFPKRWRAIKMGFSRAVAGGRGAFGKPAGAGGARDFGSGGIGNILVRDARDYAAHMDYIHFNPVKHGYVARVADWEFSSFHRCVREGVYPADWGGVSDGGGVWGERA